MNKEKRDDERKRNENEGHEMKRSGTVAINQTSQLLSRERMGDTLHQPGSNMQMFLLEKLPSLR